MSKDKKVLKLYSKNQIYLQADLDLLIRLEFHKAS